MNGMTWALLAACMINGMEPPTASNPQRRNVVILIADDLGMNHLGCFGNADVKTPHLDRLAAQGTRFTHAFATTASCSPSRSVLFTGLHNHANGQYGLAHAAHNFHGRPGVTSIFRVFKDAGFHIGLVGKKHVIPDSTYPIDFEHPVNAKDPEAIAAMTDRFLTETGDRPFLLVVGFTDPHRPFKLDANAAAAGNRKKAKAKDKQSRVGAAFGATYDPSKISMPDYLPDFPESRQDVADYFACVSRLDAGVGKVLDVLRQAGRDDDTLVLFLSDNGMPFPGAKTTLYEPGIRLPMIARMPGAAATGIANAAMLSYVDIAPTVIDWAKVHSPPNFQPHGRSALALIGKETASDWDEVFCSHTFHEVTMYYPMRAVRGRKYKLIWNLAAGLDFPFASDLYKSATWQATLERKPERYGQRTLAAYLKRPAFELYDLETDPGESNNLAQSPAHAAVLRELQNKLRDFQKRTSDPWAVKQVHE